MHPLTEMRQRIAGLSRRTRTSKTDELGLQIGKAEVVRPRLAGHRGAARVVGEGGASGCLIFIWALLTPARPRAALEIDGTRIRLWGIDAPESSQLCRGEDRLQYRCGAKAAKD